MKLIAISDVVIDNFSPRVMRNFKLEYDDLVKVKPDIIVTRMPAFGTTGPLRDRGAFGPGIDAMSGLSHLTGYSDSTPLKPGNYYCDYNAGVHAALAVMTAQQRGRVLIISSGSGRKGEPEAGPYVASKWGLIGLAKTAAMEAAKSGVTVNAILPGPTDTAMMDGPQRWKQAVPDKPNPTRDDYLEATKDATPMGYAWVRSEDIAAAAMFLLSDEARFISGDTLSIDAADVSKWT